MQYYATLQIRKAAPGAIDNSSIAERQIRLSTRRVIIGRIPEAAVFLDDDTVSRPHAELVCDPFLRWWIRDLASTNGTLVNGKAVQERLLRPGDQIQVGCFSLDLDVHAAGITDPVAQRDGPNPQPGTPKSPLAPIPDKHELRRVPAPTDVSSHIAATHLDTINDLSSRLLLIDERSDRLRAICSVFVTGFPALSAMVVRMHDLHEVTLLCGPTRSKEDSTPARYSRTVLAGVWQTRQAIVATNAAADATPDLLDDPARRALTFVPDQPFIAVIACPLWHDDRHVDLLYVELPALYGTDEWKTLVTLVCTTYQQSELIWNMRFHARRSAFIEQELQTARQIQDGLVPIDACFQDLEIAIGYTPCRWVGGDYVDAITMPDGRVLLAIADVCGKGIQAALVASSLHTMVHMTTESGAGLPVFMERINRYLCSHMPSDSFVTMVCVALDITSGALECVNAGHPPPLVVDTHGKLRQLQGEQNVALGMMAGGFDPQHTTLAPGEVLLLYTDGLTEALDDERQCLGVERFVQQAHTALATNADQTLAEIKDGITAILKRHRGAQLASDDTTFLVARRSKAALS